MACVRIRGLMQERRQERVPSCSPFQLHICPFRRPEGLVGEGIKDTLVVVQGDEGSIDHVVAGIHKGQCEDGLDEWRRALASADSPSSTLPRPSLCCCRCTVDQKGRLLPLSDLLDPDLDRELRYRAHALPSPICRLTCAKVWLTKALSSGGHVESLAMVAVWELLRV